MVGLLVRRLVMKKSSDKNDTNTYLKTSKKEKAIFQRIVQAAEDVTDFHIGFYPLCNDGCKFCSLMAALDELHDFRNKT
jgi:hypothetical protein